MTLADFIQKSKNRFREQGISVIPSIFADFVFSATAKTPVIPRVGTNIFEREWDVLLVLDATRLDMYRDRINPDVDHIWSVGSSSEEWMRHTFTDTYDEEMSRTAYITGNPFSADHCSDEAFAVLDEVWRDHWDEESGTIMPDPITDRVIHHHRAGRERVIGHYMQPHYPFVGETQVDTGGMTWEVTGDDPAEKSELALWDQFFYSVRDDIKGVQLAYEDNLDFIWNHVQRVMENTDGKVVVTADHGNALGEYLMWGHKPGMPHPEMRYVPWDEYDCRDQETYQPTVNESEATFDRERQLEDLGYL